MTNLPDTTTISWPVQPIYGCNRQRPFDGCKIGTECFNLPTTISAPTLNGYEAG
jgi:hypothetical protein